MFRTQALFVVGLLLGGTAVLPGAPAEQANCEANETDNNPGNQFAECAFECERYHVLELYVHGGQSTTKVEGWASCGGRRAHCAAVHECSDESDPTIYRGAGSCAARTHGEVWMADDLLVRCKALPGPCQDDLDPSQLELCSPGPSATPAPTVEAILHIVDGVAFGTICHSDVCVPVAPTCWANAEGRTCAIALVPEVWA